MRAHFQHKHNYTATDSDNSVVAAANITSCTDDIEEIIKLLLKWHEYIVLPLTSTNTNVKRLNNLMKGKEIGSKYFGRYNERKMWGVVLTGIEIMGERIRRRKRGRDNDGDNDGNKDGVEGFNNRSMHERFIRAVQEDWDLERIKSIAKDDDITKEVGKKDKRVKVGEKDSSKSFAVAVTVNPSASVIDGMTGRDKYGSTVMEWAGGRGRIDVVNWVVDTLKARNLGREGKNTKRTREGRTFLHFASQYGHLEMVKYVLEDVKIHGRDSKYSSHIVQGEGGEKRRTAFHSSTAIHRLLI